jgi:3-methyl-2-oxobutanoate hydroxymethyltransferase
MTAPAFAALKEAGEKIAMVTAYDDPTARWADEAGIDGVLVGDSLSMVVQGRENTLHVSLEEMIYHAEIVGRAVRHALTVVDLPFPLSHLGPLRAIESASRILQQTRCQAVKLEGGSEQAEVIAALARAGIPVMAHCGLRPQSIHQLGGYRVQRNEAALLQDAQSAVEAGAFAIVLECIPAPLARRITQTTPIPTIGIGAGPDCDGQVLVMHDVLGLSRGRTPKFVKTYARLGQEAVSALQQFRREVRAGDFPATEHSYR